MNMTPEGQELRAKLEQCNAIRKGREEDLRCAQEEERKAERAYADWLVQAYGLSKGSIIEYDNNHCWGHAAGQRVRAILDSWDAVALDGSRWNGNTYIKIIDDPDFELPTLWVRHALKSGGWSVRSYSIQSVKTANLQIL